MTDMRDWAKEFPESASKSVNYEDEAGIMDRRAWCRANFGPQDDQWCIVYTVYRGSRQFRFKTRDALTMYSMVWE